MTDEVKGFIVYLRIENNATFIERQMLNNLLAFSKFNQSAII